MGSEQPVENVRNKGGREHHHLHHSRLVGLHLSLLAVVGKDGGQGTPILCLEGPRQGLEYSLHVGHVAHVKHAVHLGGEAE